VLASRSIKRVKKILWRDLGPIEGLWVLDVKKFGPLVVAIDVHDGNLYLRR